MRENVSSNSFKQLEELELAYAITDPQVAGKRVSGGRDSGLERTADADDAESDLHGGYKGKSLCLPGRCPVCVSADGGQCDGTEALFGTARPHCRNYGDIVIKNIKWNQFPRAALDALYPRRCRSAGRS